MENGIGRTIAQSWWKRLRQGRDALLSFIAKVEAAEAEVCRLREQCLEVLPLRAENNRLASEIERQKGESATLTAFVQQQATDLKERLDEAKAAIAELKDEKHLLELEVDALHERHSWSKIVNGKLAEVIRRRLRPDNLPNRMNAIDHKRFQRQ